MTSAPNSGLKDTLGRYTVWAIRGSQKEVSRHCASWAEVMALKAEWETLGYTVQVFERRQRGTPLEGRAKATRCAPLAT